MSTAATAALVLIIRLPPSSKKHNLHCQANYRQLSFELFFVNYLVKKKIMVAGAVAVLIILLLFASEKDSFGREPKGKTTRQYID